MSHKISWPYPEPPPYGWDDLHDEERTLYIESREEEGPNPQSGITVSHLPWQYELLELQSAPSEAIKDALNRLGAEGWQAMFYIDSHSVIVLARPAMFEPPAPEPKPIQFLKRNL